MKILFVWTGVTSYMADCWRTLQRRPGVELKVIVEQVASGKEFKADHVLAGLDYQLIEANTTLNPSARAPTGQLEGFAITSIVQHPNTQTSKRPNDWLPDIMFVVGWRSKVVRMIVTDLRFETVPKICCSDMPWRWLPRCFGARFVLAGYLQRFRGMMVPGRSGARYARWLGFGKSSIFEGMYGIDTERFARVPKPCERRGFLYIGRFAPEKRLDLLVKAYVRYRERGGSWPLDLYGAGAAIPAEALRVPQLFVHSFVQPSEMPRIQSEHACLVLASDFDPWPLVVLESCASGTPVIVTDRCTNHYELVKRNGLVVRHGNVQEMALAMRRMEREYSDFDAADGVRAAKQYSCAVWTERIMAICNGQ